MKNMDGHPKLTKFPGLSTLERVTESSTGEDRDIPFPLASISKTFCGAVCALMAVDGEFGKNGIDTTLSELLEQELAKNPNSDRKGKIIKYKEMLEDKGFSDVKISELLNHRSGCKDNDELAPSSWKDRTPLEFFSNNLGRGQCKRGDYNYSNNGYVLLEEIINLTSPQGSYIKEVENRIIRPLELENTGSLEDHDNPKSQVAKTHLAQAVFIPGTDVNPHSEKVYEERTEFPANHTTPLGPVSNSCGGLYSSINDLDRFSQELAKMFTGQASSLNKTQTAAVSKLYHDQLPKELSDSMHCSLGVDVRKGFDKEGQPIFVLKKTGLFPGNYTSLEIEIKSNGSSNPIITIALQKFDYMVTEHFTEKADKIREKTIKEFLNPLLNEEEKVKFAGKKNEEVEKYFEEVEKYLIDNGRLPEDFKDTRKKIYNTFELAREEVKKFLKEKYLTDEGVIDSEKLATDFTKIKDVNRVVDPMFATKIEIANGILAESKEKIDKMTKEQKESSNVSPSSSPSASEDAKPVASLSNKSTKQ